MYGAMSAIGFQLSEPLGCQEIPTDCGIQRNAKAVNLGAKLTTRIESAQMTLQHKFLVSATVLLEFQWQLRSPKWNVSFGDFGGRMKSRKSHQSKPLHRRFYSTAMHTLGLFCTVFTQSTFVSDRKTRQIARNKS